MKPHGNPLDTIECPNCGHAIPMSEALSHQIAERARAESRAEIDKLQSSLTRKEKELQEREEKIDTAVQKRVAEEAAKIEKEAQEKARGSLSVEIQDLKNQLAETAMQRDTAQKAELEARTRARELDERARTLDLEAARKIEVACLIQHAYRPPTAASHWLSDSFFKSCISTESDPLHFLSASYSILRLPPQLAFARASIFSSRS